jgi:hypothetical protein
MKRDSVVKWFREPHWIVTGDPKFRKMAGVLLADTKPGEYTYIAQTGFALVRVEAE